MQACKSNNALAVLKHDAKQADGYGVLWLLPLQALYRLSEESREVVKGPFGSTSPCTTCSLIRQRWALLPLMHLCQCVTLPQLPHSRNPAGICKCGTR